MKRSILRLAVCGVLAIYINAFCQVDAEPEPKVFRHNLQIDALGLLSGEFGLKYEFLMKQKHGLVLEGSFLRSSIGHGNFYEISYRKHRKGTMGGGFWGFFIKQADYTNSIEQEDVRYKYSMKSVVFGPNIGKRWMLKERFSIVWRVGYGFPILDFEWTNGKPPDYAGMLESMFKFTEGLDAELSVGICF